MLDNLDSFASGLMSAGHIDVHLRNSVVKSGGSVLLVHINSASSSLVSND